MVQLMFFNENGKDLSKQQEVDIIEEVLHLIRRKPATLKVDTLIGPTSRIVDPLTQEALSAG